MNTSTELYDPETGRFSSGGALAVGRFGHTATMLEDGRVLLVGGESSGQGSLFSAEIYDPATQMSTFIESRLRVGEPAPGALGPSPAPA